MGYPYYPQNFNQFQQQQAAAAMQQYMMPMGNNQIPVQPAQMPIQNQQQGSTIIHVQSEAQAREWAVAPNSSVTFIDDSLPYCYTKSMGMSMLEPPVFKKFRLVEELETETPVPVEQPEYMTKSEFEPYKAIIDEMQKIVKELNGNE